MTTSVGFGIIVPCAVMYVYIYMYIYIYVYSYIYIYIYIDEIQRYFLSGYLPRDANP